MDRKSILVLVVCFVLLMLWYPLVNKLYPPKPRPPGATNAPAAFLTASNQPMPTPTAPAVMEVVEPHLNGPGGDVPVIVHDVRRGKAEVICGQGPAPAGATIAHYRSEGLDLVPGTGLLAACVPGTFETWMLLLRDYGTMPLREVISPAIGYAQNGHPLVERANATIAAVAELFREHLAEVGGGLFAERGRTATVAVRRRGAGVDLSPHPRGSRRRRRRSDRANRAGTKNLVAGLRRRGDRSFLPWQEVMDASGSATAACSPPTTWHAGRRASKSR